MRSERINYLPLPTYLAKQVACGLNDISRLIMEIVKQKRHCPILAFDGFPGVRWDIISALKKKMQREGFEIAVVDCFSIYKPSSVIWEIIRPYVTSDKYFGRVFDGSLKDFLDNGKVERLKKHLRKLKEDQYDAIICFGTGSLTDSLRDLYDYAFFLDIAKRKVLDRIKKEPLWFIPQDADFGAQVADVGLSLQSFKLSQYVFPAVFDKHRQNALQDLNFYIDANIEGEPKLLSAEVFYYVLSSLASSPIIFNPIYVPSPWGGQWIKEKDGLSDKDYPNCAWKFEVIPLEMSVKVNIGKIECELPGSTLIALKGEDILGESASGKFSGTFPVRFHYDDSWNGGNMALQVHPDLEYAQKHFNESTGQHEAYYIVDSKPGSKVYLGLKEGLDLKEFYNAAKKAEIKKIPMDYNKYVNSFPSNVGDLFLIPAGTIHALGKNQVCLEIGIGWGYTFHVYDYLRPDLNGNLRPIHLDHAFRSLKEYRDTKWVKKNLLQKPIILRKGKGWEEYLLGRWKGIPWEVHRMEFERSIEDNAKKGFHVLALVGGTSMEIKVCGRTKVRINCFETILMPASIGQYTLINTGKEPCIVLKVLLQK